MSRRSTRLDVVSKTNMKKGNWREEGGADSGTSNIPNAKPELADLQGWFYCIFSTYAVAHRFDDVIPTNWKGRRFLSVVGVHYMPCSAHYYHVSFIFYQIIMLFTSICMTWSVCPKKLILKLIVFSLAHAPLLKVPH